MAALRRGTASGAVVALGGVETCARSACNATLVGLGDSSCDGTGMSWQEVSGGRGAYRRGGSGKIAYPGCGVWVRQIRASELRSSGHLVDTLLGSA
jgi:hypothetical protein